LFPNWASGEGVCKTIRELKLNVKSRKRRTCTTNKLRPAQADPLAPPLAKPTTKRIAEGTFRLLSLSFSLSLYIYYVYRYVSLRKSKEKEWTSHRSSFFLQGIIMFNNPEVDLLRNTWKSIFRK